MGRNEYGISGHLHIFAFLTRIKLLIFIIFYLTSWAIMTALLERISPNIDVPDVVNGWANYHIFVRWNIQANLGLIYLVTYSVTISSNNVNKCG